MNDEQNLDLDVSQDETETLDEESTDSVDEEQVSDSEESLEAEDDSEIDWRTRAIKAEKAIENAKKAQKQEAKPVKKSANALNPDEDIRAEIAALKLAERKRQFGYEYGLSPKETDKVFQVNPDPDADTLKDPFIKAGIEALRRQERVANNSLSPSAKAGTFSPKKFSKLTPQEREAEFKKYMKTKGVLNG